MNKPPFRFRVMETKPDALDHLNVQFQWGNYGLHVLRCHLASFAPGHTIPFHEHSEFEFHFVPRGKGKVIIEDQSFDLQEGLFYLTGPHVVHYQEADAIDGMEELCLHINIVKLFDKDDVPDNYWGNRLDILEADACINQLKSLPLRPTTDSYDAMSWFLLAYEAWSEKKLGLYSTIQQAVIQILLRSVQAFEMEQSKIGISSRNMKEHRYLLATQFIADNYARPLSLDDVADKISISGRQLQRIFLEQTGLSFSKYLEDIRISNICEELVNSETPIHDIATKHGFSNSNYLFLFFANG